ncbi:MAG: hypothetical protein CL609_05080 [Anaerolineaceae bacterium]|nr:hypothetical protein [Anaerolineaceae bacterium]
MSLYSAIETFPDEWSRKARCPICKGIFLQIFHFPNSPDQMHCPQCEVVFTIEQKGEHLFFVKCPNHFPDSLKDRWVTRYEISEKIAKSVNNGPSAAVNIPTANPLRAEAVRRARNLVQLGNSKENVRKALAASMQLTEFAIEEILTDAFNVYQIKQKKQFKTTAIFTGIITGGIILLVILLSFWF